MPPLKLQPMAWSDLLQPGIRLVSRLQQGCSLDCMQPQYASLTTAAGSIFCCAQAMHQQCSKNGINL